jgi:hypothetical protein
LIAWPSVATLAARGNLSTASVERAIRELCSPLPDRCAMFKKERGASRADGRLVSNQYTLCESVILHSSSVQNRQNGVSIRQDDGIQPRQTD